MKYFLFTICFSLFSLASLPAHSQQTDWPKSFRSSTGLQVRMYKPQPESFAGNQLKIRAAVSFLSVDESDPVFGVIWADINTQNASNNDIAWQSASVTNIKFPGKTSEAALDELSAAFESELPSWNVVSSRNELMANVESSEKEIQLSENLNTSPPKIIYSKQPSILVSIDGPPQYKNNTEWGVEQVINTPFPIVKTNNQDLFLYGDKKWYSSRSIDGPWNPTDRIPSGLAKVDREVRANDTSTAVNSNNVIPEIILSTEPSELIQSDGEANFSPIQGTNLLFMTNTANDIFMDVNSQQYYVLISGRWYKANNLSSAWTYTSSQDLPPDFSKIPAGSSKDNVLANVAGTDAANESVLEAQVPQTAKVDRKNATAKVVYDGDPRFEDIEGTDLRYAVNTPGAVLNTGRRYYYVENGVWFESGSANGPWMVAAQRPAQVENIPPDYPVYNVKYVYIYDVTPDYVYMGYTPGYLGTYIYGPTIVYGTGYYYKPWRGRYYYPRATTWGFNMRYTPWTGWGFGVNLWAGWFSLNIGNFHRGPVWGGWWGPPVYRPSYCGPYNNYYGQNYYGQRRIVNNYTIVNNRTNNIYRYRRDVVTHDRPAFNDSRYRGSSRPVAGNNGGYNRNNEARPGRNSADQRPTGSYPGNRTVTRNYEPSGNQRRTENNNNNTTRDNNRYQDRSRIYGQGQRDANPQIYGAGTNNQGTNNNNPTRDNNRYHDRSRIYGQGQRDANPQVYGAGTNNQGTNNNNPTRDNNRYQDRSRIYGQGQRDANPQVYGAGTNNQGRNNNVERPARERQEGFINPSTGGAPAPQQERPGREFNRARGAVTQGSQGERPSQDNSRGSNIGSRPNRDRNESPVRRERERN